MRQNHCSVVISGSNSIVSTNATREIRCRYPKCEFARGKEREREKVMVIIYLSHRYKSIRINIHAHCTAHTQRQQWQYSEPQMSFVQMYFMPKLRLASVYIFHMHKAVHCVYQCNNNNLIEGTVAYSLTTIASIRIYVYTAILYIYL